MKQEVYSLIKLAQSGDKKAMEELTINNSGLIWNAVKKFSGRNAEKEDLFQIGAIGLLKAVKKFDDSFNVEFSTYAVPMILGEIKRFLRDDGMIKVSRSIKETGVKIHYAAERLAEKNGKDATLCEIASYLGISIGEVATALEATREPDSIYRAICDGDNSPVLLVDKLCSRDNDEEKILNNVALKNGIEKLDVRERQILILRYYKEKTQSEVAKMLGLSQVQISRIEKKVLASLRKNIV